MTLRTPDLHHDGWTLDDGEERHREAPDTFPIPSLQERMSLQPGDFAKLMFRIAIADDSHEAREAVERMWVIITATRPDGYLGVLDSVPTEIEQNDSFWLGAELPFQYRHVIAIQAADEDSRALARQPPGIPWVSN